MLLSEWVRGLDRYVLGAPGSQPLDVAAWWYIAVFIVLLPFAAAATAIAFGALAGGLAFAPLLVIGGVLGFRHRRRVRATAGA